MKKPVTGTITVIDYQAEANFKTLKFQIPGDGPGDAFADFCDDLNTNGFYQENDDGTEDFYPAVSIRKVHKDA